MRRPLLLLVSTALCVLVPMGVAGATPVAKTKEEREDLGRTFVEPMNSSNYIQFGEGGHGEFEWGFELLEELFPRYLELTTVAEELGKDTAVSVGQDGFPAWERPDTGDGLPLHVVIATDENVPDRNKEYIVLTAGHSGEPCGREGGARFIEDLVIAATEDPDRVFDNAQGIGGKTFEMTAPEILKATKIFFISPSPDGWLVGDGSDENSYSQYNGAGVNSNRLAYTDGWVFPPNPVLYLQGYSTYTQPEGIAMTTYLRKIRETELKGRPFAIGMDLHGPLPFGFILLHDEGNDPQKLEMSVDLGTRVRQNMEETIPAFGPADTALDLATGLVRDNLPDLRQLRTLDNDSWRLQGWGRWGFVTHIVDSLGYTAGGSWGGFFASNAGLDAVSLSYEINCRNSKPWIPADHQVWANNVRKVMETGVVTAAAWDELPRFEVETDRKVGFYEPGERITDKDGNPSPLPHLTNPIAGRLSQEPYDVANTDYFRDLANLVKPALTEVRPAELPGALPQLDTFAVADATVEDTEALNEFVTGGGDLVLTDSALQMLPSLTDLAADTVKMGWGYVGYSDLDRSHPLTQDALTTAWQTYAPTSIGYPLLMERDGYWDSSAGEGGEASKPSPTKNSAKIWTVDRDAWEAAGGVTVGTADPPADRKSVTEGNLFEQFGKRDADQDLTEIGILPVGDGRIIIFGALLPQPTEAYPHWFGLNAYSVSHAGQKMVVRALTGQF